MPDADTLDTIIAGSWYLPASPEHRVGGKLHVQPDGRTLLEVAGTLDDEAGAWDLSESEDLIHGIGTDGTFYSLFNCELSSARFGVPPDDVSGSFPDFSDYSQYVWSVSYYTDGRDFVDDATDVTEIHVSFSVLREWMSVEESLESVWSERRESRIVIPQEREYVCEINGTSVTLHDWFKASATRYKSSVEYEPYFEISEPSTTIGTVVSDWILPLQRLMMFLSSYYAHITMIRIRCCDSERFVDLHLQTPHATTESPPARFFDFYLHRATLDDMGVSLDSIIENWFQLESKYAYLGEVIDELTSRNHRYDEVVLLLVFRVVEFFHDNEIGGQRGPPDQHELRVEQIVSHIPAETDREWVRGVLIEKNRKSLSTVLREVLQWCGQVGALVIEHHPDFVRKARRTRSKVAHTRDHDQESSEEVAAICIGLVWIVRRIVTEMVLNSDQHADDYISSHSMFRRYLGESEELA